MPHRTKSSPRSRDLVPAETDRRTRRPQQRRSAFGGAFDRPWGALRQMLFESNTWIFLVLLAMIGTFSAISPSHAFFTLTNFVAIAVSGAEILILAVGSTFVMVTGSIDLSIGSVLVLSSVVGVETMSRVMKWGASDSVAIFAGVGAALVVGILTGLLNGVLTTRLRMPSFIVTLGTLGVTLGIAQLLTVGSVSKTVPDALVNFGLSRILGVPMTVLIAAVVTVPTAVVLAGTRFGLHCYAVGSNREGARRAGIRVDRTIVAVFVIMGGLASVAGIVDLARFSSASVAAHQSDNLAAIAAVIIGGTSLFGGRGTIGGTVIGTLIPVVLLQGLVIEGVNPYWQNIAIGAVLVIAVAIDQAQRDRVAKGKLLFKKSRRAESPLPALGLKTD
jgi:ribose transport system permease protein